MKQTIYLVRHAQYENPLDVNAGRTQGFHLSETGKIQAKNLSNYFVDKGITQIFSSPMERAFETAQIISKPINIDVQIAENLNETYTPYFEGRPFKEIKEILGEGDFFLNKNHLDSGGETFEQMQDRFMSFLFEKLNRGMDRIILVSHGDPLSVLLIGIQNLQIDLTKDISNQVLYMEKGDLVKVVFEDGKFSELEKIII